MIHIKYKGDFGTTLKWMDRMLNREWRNILHEYGEIGLEILRNATPVDTGITAESWYYSIADDGRTASLTFHNDTENKGINIVVLLRYGHGTRNGGYVQPNDFVTPALEPVFNAMALEAWEEVTK